MKKLSIIILIALTVGVLQAEETAMQFFRPNNLNGMNIFETSKQDNVPFDGMKVQVGGGFTQDLQMLEAENNPTPAIPLVKLGTGFNLAMANLTFDVQLADGIRLNLTTYLSSRHHQEAWVKNGYIQIDKLSFLNSKFIDKVMENVTIKVGDLEVNYGDQHFRRTDGGNSILNPFVENYIMDAFATEIGGEVYYHTNFGLFAMLGVTNGALNPTVIAPTAIDSATKEVNYQAPAMYGKLGYDKTFGDLRLRLTGSYYGCESALANTLFWGDRTGSHYFLAMEPATGSDGKTPTNAKDAAWSGRFNPSFRQQVSTIVINPFIKWKGLEFFGTYEMASGRTITEKEMRNATQMAADLLYRFAIGQTNFYVGARYNTVTATLPVSLQEVTINRMVASAGWFVTKNMVLKAEYVSQEYKDYPLTSVQYGGKFSGLMLSAAVGF